LPLAEANTPTLSAAYVLVRATQVPASVGTDNVAGEALTDGWDFSIHVYDPAVSNTGTLESKAGLGQSIHPEVNVTFEKGADTTSAQLTIPVGGVSPLLTPADIANIVSAWSVYTSYDYTLEPAALVDTVDEPLVVTYESSLLNTEFAPAAGPTIDSVTVRLYDFSAFTLRKNSGEQIAADLKGGIDVTVLSGTGHGPTCGGTRVTITSTKGGLAYVKRVTFDGKNARKILTPAGTNDFMIEVVSPTHLKPEAVDIDLYLGTNTDAPVVLTSAFTYQRTGVSIWGILLGLGALLTAMAAQCPGCDSGGGGGPCFIATAAYGTPMAADIDTLRAFRDTYLLHSSVGTAFVDTYYRVSPFVADIVAQSPFLAAVVRLLLAPVIFVLKTPLTMMVLLSVGAMMVAVRKHLRRKA